MRLYWFCISLLSISFVGDASGQTFPAPSYTEIEASLSRLENEWKSTTPAVNLETDPWKSLVGSIRNDLKTYAQTNDPNERVAALNRLHQSAASLDQTVSPTAAQLRDDLLYWLNPRVTLAWAEYQTLAEYPKGSPERERWTDFIEKTLRPAIGTLEGAKTAADRARAIEAIDAVLSTLQQRTELPANSRSDTLLATLANLYVQPNVEVTIDHSALSNFIMPKGIVEPGPIFFKGQWSYVTPGPVQGIGFSPTSDGIQVVIQQALTSTTNVQGFEQQMEAADPRARQATSMYRFAANTQNNSVLTSIALFRIATGLQLAQGYQHAVSAAINTTPVAGAGMKRFIASLLGQNQKAITDKVYQGFIERLPSEVASNARELSQIRASEAAAKTNAQIRPYVLDHQTVGLNGVGVTDLKLSTGTDHARALGTIYSFNAPKPHRATFPQPRRLQTFQPGITADLHLPSVLANLTEGAFKNPEFLGTNSLLIDAGESTPEIKVAPTITPNVEFPSYLDLVKQGQKNGKTPQVIRVQKPSRAPDFGVGSNGDLLISVPDFQIDIPAPPQIAGGGAIAGPAASVYRISAPSANVGLSLFLDRSNPAAPPTLKAKVTSFNLDPKLSVKAIQQDEGAAQALNPILARLVSTGLSSRIVGQTFDLPVSALNRPDVALMDVSPLDPSGWLRLILMPLPRG